MDTPNKREFNHDDWARIIEANGKATVQGAGNSQDNDSNTDLAIKILDSFYGAGILKDEGDRTVSNFELQDLIHETINRHFGVKSIKVNHIRKISRRDD